MRAASDGVALGEADRALQPLRLATCRHTGKPGQGAVEHILGPDWVAGHEPGLGQGDFPFGAAGIVGRQVGRAPQQRGPGRVAAAGARAFGRVLQFGRELLVGDDRRRGQVPHAQLRVARFAPAHGVHAGDQQRSRRDTPRTAAAGSGTGPSCRETPARRPQPFRLRPHPGRCRPGPPRATAGPAHPRVGRGQQRERLGVWRQAAYLAQEVLLEPLAERKRFGRPARPESWSAVYWVPSSTSASGLLRVSARMRSTACALRAPPATELSSYGPRRRAGRPP